MIHTITEYRRDFPPAYLANGVLGLRVGKFPMLKGTAVINGYVGVLDSERTEGYAPAPYPLHGDLMLNGVWLSQRQDLAVFREQSCDFSSGELTTRFDFSSNGAIARVTIVTFCCRSMPTLAVQEVRVQVDRPCDLTFRASLDSSGVLGECLHREVVDPGWDVADGSIHFRSPGGLATQGAAYLAVCSEKVERKRNTWGHNALAINSDYKIEAQSGRDYVLWHLGCLVPSILHPEPERQAIRLIGIAKYRGFEGLRRENREAWAELWKGRVKLLGADEKWQQILDAAFFYLHSSVHQASPCSIAPYALGHWASFYGHVFWDADTWMFPSVLLTAPHAARAMLDYRSRMLPGARANAALNGYRGLLFPWQSGVSGDEFTPAWIPGDFAQQHINTDVAYAFTQYAHASGDEQFFQEQAWPILEGVAEWLVSRVKLTERGYEIRSVTGVDESCNGVHNDVYTNLSAILILRDAASAARRLRLRATGSDVAASASASHTGSNIAASATPELWEEIAARIFVPTDPQSKVLLNHDAYQYKSGPCLPEALLAMFPLPCRVAPEIEDATYRFYLPLLHTQAQFPFTPQALAVHAARRGDRKLSAALFEASVPNQVVTPFMQFREWGNKITGDAQSAWPPFVPNAGSTVMSCLYGLTGLVLGPGEPQSWCQHPITMPEGWDGIEVDRIWARGKPARLTARQGDARAKIEC